MDSAVRLSKNVERLTLWILAGVQFTHVLDFMMMMPLGPQLMRVFAISPAQFSRVVAVYCISAAVSGIISGSIIDRYDRKRALLVLYSGFVLSNFACAFAPNYWALVLARISAGAFGGVASSLVVAMVGDVIPPHARGRGMGVVMTAFPVATALGIPFALYVASIGSWHTPFVLLGTLGILVALVAGQTLPSIRIPQEHAHPIRQMLNLLSNRVHQRALAMSASLIVAGSLIIPFLAASIVTNVGVNESQLFWIYLCGGAVTFFTTPFVGQLSDRFDKLHVLAWISLGGAIMVVVITRLPATNILTALALTSLFTIFMSGRFSPAMALVGNALDPRYRAGFMSLNSATQQAAGGAANLVAGLFVTADATGRLHGYPTLGLLSAAAMGLTVFLAYRVRQLAPHAAHNRKSPIATAAVPVE